MTDLSRRLEQTLRSAIQKNPILPVKVEDGILVGEAKIVSDDHIKHIYFKGVLVYKDVSLNAVAIKLANILARRNSSIQGDALYRADQEYGRWFTESQMLRTQYQRSIPATPVLTAARVTLRRVNVSVRRTRQLASFPRPILRYSARR